MQKLQRTSIDEEVTPHRLLSRGRNRPQASDPNTFLLQSPNTRCSATGKCVGAILCPKPNPLDSLDGLYALDHELRLFRSPLQPSRTQAAAHWRLSDFEGL